MIKENKQVILKFLFLAFIIVIFFLLYRNFKLTEEKKENNNNKKINFSFIKEYDPTIIDFKLNFNYKKLQCYKINLEGHCLFVIENISNGANPFTVFHFKEECFKCLNKGKENE